MPPRTKTAHSASTGGNEAPPDSTGTSPRRSARFAPALTPTLPVASTSRVHVHALPATPAGQRILRPASARRLSAKAQAGDAPPSPAQRGKRKSPDVHTGEREDVRTKRARVRCPAEVRFSVLCPFHCRFLFRFIGICAWRKRGSPADWADSAGPSTFLLPSVFRLLAPILYSLLYRDEAGVHAGSHCALRSLCSPTARRPVVSFSFTRTVYLPLLSYPIHIVTHPRSMFRCDSYHLHPHT